MIYAIVTGGNAGMGIETAKELCKLGYNVTITARSKDKGEMAVSEISSAISGANVQYTLMECKSLKSVASCAKLYIEKGLPLHLLINNAGIMNTPFEMTEDGIEAQFQVNHLSHFLFTHYLLPVIIKSGGGRVVNVSSRAHMRWSQPLDMNEVTTTTADSYDGWGAYGRSKLSNILFTRLLAKKFPLGESKVNFFSLHPGLVDTKLLNVSAGLKAQAIPIEEGIKTCMLAATSPDVANISGEYFHDCAVTHDPRNISSYAQSDEEAMKLWIGSLKLVGLSDLDYGK